MGAATSGSPRNGAVDADDLLQLAGAVLALAVDLANRVGLAYLDGRAHGASPAGTDAAVETHARRLATVILVEPLHEAILEMADALADADPENADHEDPKSRRRHVTPPSPARATENEPRRP